MLKQAAFFLAFVIFMLAAFVTSERTFSPFFQACVSENQNTDKTSAAEKQRASFGPIVSRYVQCSGRFIDVHGVGITALASIVIAAFTGTLWIATSRQATLTKASVRIAERALTELEAPFPIIKINAPGLKVEGNSISFGLLQYCVANYGKTPAAILELCESIGPMPIETGYAPPIDPVTKIGQFMPYGVIAPPMGQSDDFPYLPIGQFMEGIIMKKTTIFFYGFVRYEDILKNRFVLGFCFEFEPKSNRWILTGDDKYNYRRKETKPEADARMAIFAPK